jgi:hypothetical protein
MAPHLDTMSQGSTYLQCSTLTEVFSLGPSPPPASPRRAATNSSRFLDFSDDGVKITSKFAITSDLQDPEPE